MKSASDCECDDLVHSDGHLPFGFEYAKTYINTIDILSRPFSRGNLLLLE